MKTDVEYCNFYGKFRKKEGDMMENNLRHKHYRWKGNGVDIFAIEKTSYIAARLGKLFYQPSHKRLRHTVSHRYRSLCVFPPVNRIFSWRGYSHRAQCLHRTCKSRNEGAKRSLRIAQNGYAVNSRRAWLYNQSKRCPTYVRAARAIRSRHI